MKDRTLSSSPTKDSGFADRKSATRLVLGLRTGSRQRANLSNFI